MGGVKLDILFVIIGRTQKIAAKIRKKNEICKFFFLFESKYGILKRIFQLPKRLSAKNEKK